MHVADVLYPTPVKRKEKNNRNHGNDKNLQR